MINTKENIKNTSKNANKNKGNFFSSLKNKREFQFKTEAERLLMLLCEFDPSVNSYRQLEYKMLGIQNGSELEYSAGLIVERDDNREFIILSDRLTNDKRLAQDVFNQIHKGETHPVSLTALRPGDVETDILPKNINSLYQYVLLPACREDFSVIKEIMEFCGEVSIKQLKRRVENWAAIYQLIFHGGLRADLESGLISDDTTVNASPLMKSIIKSL